MPNILKYEDFLNLIDEKYYKIEDFKKFPVKVQNFINNNIDRFNSVGLSQVLSPLNCMVVNFQNILKKSKKKNYKFIENNTINDLQFFIFEYLKPYYDTGKVNKFCSAEFITMLCVYNKVEDKIISHLETRNLINHFQVYGEHGFIGFINTEPKFQRMGIATFTLQVSSLYLWIRLRKKLYSDTLMSDQFINCCRTLSKKTKWVIREDYFNSNSQKEQERYLIKPLKIGVTVKDSNQIYYF